MKCPNGHDMSIVVDSRSTRKGIRRRRKCEACGARYSTLEVLAEDLEAPRVGVQEALRIQSKFERSIARRFDSYDEDGILIPSKPIKPVRRVFL